MLEVTAFEHPHDYAEHFKAPLRADDRGAQANAAQGTAARPSSTRRSTRFCDEWNRGTADRARFEMEYLLTVGTRSR